MGILELLFALGFAIIAFLQTAISVTIGLGRRVVAATPMYLLILFIATIVAVGLGLLLVPLFVIIKVITGAGWAVYTAAIIAVTLTGLLALLWTPLAFFVGAVLNPLHPIQAGQRYVHNVAVLLFAELMFAMGLLIVPFHNNLGAMPFFFLAGATFILSGLLWGGRLGPQFYRGVATVAFALVLLSFFLPRTFQVTGQKMGGIDQAIACAVNPDHPGCPRPAATTPHVQALPKESFAVQAGTTMPTVLDGPGRVHRIWANRPFEILAGPVTHKMPQGISGYGGSTGLGMLTVRAGKEDTEIQIWTQVQ